MSELNLSYGFSVQTSNYNSLTGFESPFLTSEKSSFTSETRRTVNIQERRNVGIEFYQFFQGFRTTEMQAQGVIC